MTTKEDELFLKQHHSLTDHSHSDKSILFSNFNLNQSQKCSSSVHFNSKSNNNKNYASKNPNLNNGIKEKELNQKYWKNDKNDSCSRSSTLSLHIAAYENSIESSIEIKDLSKKSKASKFINSLPKFQLNQDLIEFPRQMDDAEKAAPEIQQFSASQKLFSPNQSSSSSNRMQEEMETSESSANLFDPDNNNDQEGQQQSSDYCESLLNKVMPSCKKSSSRSNAAIDAFGNFMHQTLVEHTDILELAYSKESEAEEEESRNRSESSSSSSGGEEDHISGTIKKGSSVAEAASIYHKNDINGNITVRSPNEFEHISKYLQLSVYLAWFVLISAAYFRAFLKRIGFEKNKAATELDKQKDFVPLYSSFEALYSQHCYIRVRDVFERPICSCPGATVHLKDRVTNDFCWSFQFTGTETEVINVGSYNYLGFAQPNGPCAEQAAQALQQHGLSMCGTVQEIGNTQLQEDLEKLVAEFIGTEDAICFSMGFATNSMNAPCLVDKNSLIVSDQYNHASLILGCRLSKASIKVFKHNDMKSLEKILRDAIAYGNPKTCRPYKKILIVVEGIYSMEGSLSNLPEIIALKKKYKCYLYLDEAHSIGAMGSTGRGVVEYWGCDPRDVDIMMGTFTKSFGAAGGYIGGSKEIISHLRKTSPTGFYSAPMSAPVVQQVIASMSIIMGRDGTRDGEKRIERLSRNSRYFRRRLKQMGFILYGSDDSPVVPILLYFPTQCGLWGRELLKKKIGVVVVSFPATEMTEARARICLSAAHTKEQLDYVLNAMDEMGDFSRSKFSRKTHLYKDLKIEW